MSSVNRPRPVMKRRSSLRLTEAPMPLLAMASAPHVRGGRLDRLDDIVIAGAAAQIAIEPLPDLPLRGIRLALEQVDRAHDHARRAEAALQRMVLAKGRLHRVQLAVPGQALDGR